MRATFSEEMQEASVMNAFKLFRKGPTNQIAAAVTYDAATDTATLNPTNNLKRGVIYKAVVSTLAKDVEGNRLAQDDSPLERERTASTCELRCVCGGSGHITGPSPSPSALALIHRSAWKVNSRDSTSRTLHSLPLWER
jgi:Bacterial Ig-like domain